MTVSEEQSYASGASAQAIRQHYDIGNDFYRLFLDKTMTYSGALWQEGERAGDLEAAQIRKLDFHINQARAGRAKRVLDIGCGWGSLLHRLVEAHEVEYVVGLTLSDAQASWINSLDQARHTVLVQSWSEHNQPEPYDAIISIGAFEHFAKPELSVDEKIEAYRHFFGQCHNLLKQGGRMSLQTIAMGNILPGGITPLMSEIFPESNLPRLAEIAAACERVFEVKALHDDRQGYSRTLRYWLKNLKDNRAEAVALIGEQRTACFERYFQHSIFGFASGATNLLRITLERIDKPCLARSSEVETSKNKVE